MNTAFTSRSLASAISGLALTLACTASGQSSGFYAKVDVGGNITRDTELESYFGPVSPGSKVKFDPGFRFGIAGGYQVTSWFAPEIEFGAMENFVKDMTEARRVDAVFSNVPFLVNAKFQIPNRSPFTPYFGGGVGGAVSVLDIDYIEINDIGTSGTGSDVVFAYQGFAGVRYAVNERMGLSFEYRYFGAGSPSFEADFAETGADRIKFGRAETHSFSLAFDFRF